MSTDDLWNKPLKAACMRERKFQDAKYREMSKVHDVLDNPEYTADEKYIMLTTQLGYGKQRAQELCYGMRRTEFK